MDTPNVRAGWARIKYQLKSGRARSGVTVHGSRGERLDEAWVRRQFADNKLTGVETTSADVAELILEINRLFLLNGYINSGLVLEQQSIASEEKGILKLNALRVRLVHGRLIRLGSKHLVGVTWVNGVRNGLSDHYIRERLPSARHIPLDGGALERDFRLLADDPAIRVANAKLEPGGEPGEATLSVSIIPQPRFDVYATYANNRSPAVGSNRMSVGGSIRNVVLGGDLLAFEAGNTAGFGDASGSYTSPITPKLSARLRLGVNKSGVVSEGIKNLDIRSSDTVQEAGLSYRIINAPLTPVGQTGRWTPAETVDVGVTYSHRTSKSSLLGQPFSFSPGAIGGKSDYSVARINLDWTRRAEAEVISISTTGSIGLTGSGSDIPGLPRPDKHFETAGFQANYARRLNDGSLELHARLAGQVASGLLFVGEQIAVGGSTSVRGYRENLDLGGTGAVGSVELSCAVRLGSNPCGRVPDGWQTVRVTPFFDAGYERSSAVVQPKSSTISSVGASVNWTPVAGVSARLTYGHQLKAVKISGPADLQDRGISFEISVHPINLVQRFWSGVGTQFPRR